VEDLESEIADTPTGIVEDTVVEDVIENLESEIADTPTGIVEDTVVDTVVDTDGIDDTGTTNERYNFDSGFMSLDEIGIPGDIDPGTDTGADTAVVTPYTDTTVGTTDVTPNDVVAILGGDTNNVTNADIDAVAKVAEIVKSEVDASTDTTADTDTTTDIAIDPTIAVNVDVPEDEEERRRRLKRRKEQQRRDLESDKTRDRKSCSN
jgi:hypothetical protein